MTDTILVVGPRGAGKSKFIELLAGPTKPLQPNGVSTDTLRTITVSPYFTDGKTIKLVKFPGFDESDTNLTDAALFVGIATFLGSYIHRDERIRAIIYLHPVIVDKSKVDDVGRNIKMLRKIVPQGAVQNIVVVTTGDQISITADNIRESRLPGDLTGRGVEKPLRYDGTKLSALIILESATKKTAIRLDLKHKAPGRTDAGKELIDHIDRVIEDKRDQGKNLARMIEEEDDESENVKKWEDERSELRGAWRRLEDDKKNLGVSINLEQATEDNKRLEGVIKEQRESATKDWKSAYGKLEEEKAALLNEKKALQTKVDNAVKPFSVQIRAKEDYAGNGSGILPHRNGELLHTTQDAGLADWILAQNSAGRVGAAYGPRFNK